MRFDKPRSSWLIAARRCDGEVASIKSPTASACSTSIFPLITARLVNSPGVASLAPA